VPRRGEVVALLLFCVSRKVWSSRSRVYRSGGDGLWMRGWQSAELGESIFDVLRNSVVVKVDRVCGF